MLECRSPVSHVPLPPAPFRSKYFPILGSELILSLCDTGQREGAQKESLQSHFPGVLKDSSSMASKTTAALSGHGCEDV